jgi:hypothetical protein
MRDLRIELQTTKTVKECAETFRGAVQASYGGVRKLHRAAGMLRGAITGGDDTGGIEFFTPNSSPFDSATGEPAWKAGAFVPGFSKMYGASKMAVHIYVVDQGDKREVQLVGPYGMGDKGSTERLLQAIASRF